MKRILRPWPLLPLPSLIIIFIFVEIQNLYFGILAPQFANCRLSCLTVPSFVIPLITAEGSQINATPHDVVGNLLNAAAAATALALTLLIFQSIIGKNITPRGWQFITALVISSLVGTAARLTVLPLLIPVASVEAVLAVATRYVILLWISHVLLGISSERYRAAISAAKEAEADATQALSKVKEQQSLVVEADERVRREIANFLHDRVQAGLLVAAMQVRQALDTAPETTKSILEPAIADLERLRVDDVRAAGRRLSPDLNTVGLDSALKDLARSWSAAMKVAIDCQPAVMDVLREQEDVSIATAAYRTVEQALLNSAAHGRAEMVEVEVSIVDSFFLLTIRDNGAGLPASTEPGSGSALIDAWMGAVRGRWNLTNRDTGGCVLTAVIPLN